MLPAVRPTEMVSPSLVIRWAESESPRYHWCIRGLRPDGSFHGEVRSTFDVPRVSDGAHGVGRSVTGHITESEVDRVHQLAEVIRSNPSPDANGPVVGVLAEGPMSNPLVLLRCDANPERTAAVNAFLEILAILRPYLSCHYSSMT
jgi:hypothetical protein